MSAQSDELMVLLARVIVRVTPQLSERVKTLGDLNALTIDELAALEGGISGDFVRVGLGPDDEPNDQGLLLEALLDHLVRVRTRGSVESDERAG